MQIPIINERLARVTFDFSVNLYTEAGAEFRIETPFDLSMQDQTAETVDPTNVTSYTRSALLEWVGWEIGAADASESGFLRLSTKNGKTIVVSPHANYEAWTFSAADGMKLVALPNGGLSAWD